MIGLDLYTGAPFWAVRDGLPANYPALDRDTSADVVVVGAGISGAFIAYELARASVSVIVVDRRDVAAGSSAASTGLLMYETDTSFAELSDVVGPDAAARVYEMGLDAIDDIETFCSIDGRHAGFRRRPGLYLASTPRHSAALEAEFRSREQRGFDVEWLDSRAIATCYGFSRPAAIRTRGTAEVDCYRLTHNLLAAAVDHGAHVYDRTSVALPTRSGSRFRLQTSRGHALTADRVIWATGYEAHALFRRRVGRLASTWVFASEPVTDFSGWADRCLIWETARPYTYARTTDDGRVIVGGEDEPCAQCHRTLRWSTRKTDRLLEHARDLFPRIPLEVAYAWAGTFSLTDDGLPFIGENREHPGVWFALGYGGNGITFSAIAARVLRDLAMGRASPDAALFGWGRGK